VAVPLKVMTFNILFGGEERFSRILALIAHEQPDLLVLQECLGWEDGERMRHVAQALHLPATEAHLRLGTARPRGSGRRYHVGIASRRPLRTLQVHNDPSQVGHCLVQCELESDGPLTVFGTHYDAHAEEPRLREAKFLNGLLSPTTFREGLYLLAGDLNSLSRRDPYPANLAAQVRAAGTDKYGHPPSFSVIDELETFGWVDTLYHRQSTPSWVTAQRERGGVVIDYRTDYIFASPRMASRLLHSRVVDVGTASDHHAVVALFDEAP
jgi:exodeoxyribonuclease-3